MKGFILIRNFKCTFSLMCFPITLIEKKIFIQQTVFFGNWKKNSICWPARPVSHSECFAQLEMVFFLCFLCSVSGLLN